MNSGNHHKIKVAIFGTGSMGAFFAMRLREHADVCVIGSWKEQIEALNRELKVEEQDGSITRAPIRGLFTDEVNESFDLILLLVKSRQTETVAQKCKSLLNKERTIGQVLTLQNGAGHIETIKKYLPEEHILAGVTNQAAALVEPGHVRDAGPGAIFLDNREDRQEAIKAICGLFERAGFNVHLQEDIQSLIWSKLIVNSGINPLTAILGVNNGYLSENEPARTGMINLAKEALSVAQAYHIPIPYADKVEAYICSISKATHSNHSSMLKDVWRKVPTEIDAITGYIIRHAITKGIQVPYSRFVYNQVKRIESGVLMPDTNNKVVF